MKRIFLTSLTVLFFGLFLAEVAKPQAVPLVTYKITVDPPSGAQCSAFNTIQANSMNGKQWACPIDTKVWTQVNAAGGGGATTPATSLVLKGNGATNAVAVATPGTDYVVPGGNVATATAFQNVPTVCSGAQKPTGVDVNGNATGCSTPATSPGGSNGQIQINNSGTLGGIAAPAGALVGTTASQALSNKDFTGTGNTFPTFNQNTTGQSGSALQFASAPGQAPSNQYCTGITISGSCNAAQVLYLQLGGTNPAAAGAAAGASALQPPVSGSGIAKVVSGNTSTDVATASDLVAAIGPTAVQKATAADTSTNATNSVNLSGPLLGTIVGNQGTTAVVGLQTVDGVTNTSIAGAISASGPGGAVSVPATYPCTEQFTANTNGVHVFSARPCDHTSFDIREFGAKGDGSDIAGCTGTSGQFAVSCTSRPFVSTDGGRIIGLSITGASAYITTISSVNTSTGVATVANALPSTLAGTQHTWLTTDDTAAEDAWCTFLNAHPGATGTIQNGWYWFSHTCYLTQDVLIQGQGFGTTHIINASPNRDWFVFNGSNSDQGGVEAMRDMSFYGLGNFTTGNMIVQAHTNLFLSNLLFAGSAGRSILGAAEGLHATGIITQDMRQVLTNPDNVAWNESTIDNYRISNPGIVFNGVFGNGGLWNWNINSVNGVFPASGNILQDQHAAIDLANTSRVRIGDGTIKPLTGIGAIKNRGAVGQFAVDNLYCELFSASAASPCFTYGGQRETAAGSAGISSTALQIPLMAGQTACGVVNCTGAIWWPGYIGNPADIALVGNAGGANTPFSTIYPPDFLAGSGAASSIGSGILRGDFEQVRMQGMVNDAGGFSAYLITGGRGLNGTTAKAWPLGFVFQQGITESFGAYATLTNNRFLTGAHDSTTWPVTQNADLGQTKAGILVGQTPDLFHVPGSANALTQTRQVFFGPGNFLNAAVGMNPVEAATSATMISIASGNQASPCATPNYIYMSGFQLNAVRDYYANGQGAFMSYLDPTMETPMSVTGANTNAPRGTCATQGNVNGSITGSIKTYFGTYTLQDNPDPTTGQSLQRCSVLGNLTTLAGFECDVWNGTTWTNVYQLGTTISQASPAARITMQMVNGTWSLVTSGSTDTTMTFPGSTSSNANIITTAGTGPLDFMDKTHCFLDHSGQFRNNGTCSIGTPTAGMNSVNTNVLVGTGSAPTITGCGTGPTLTTGSTNLSGSVTEGTAATGCTITWATAFSATPISSNVTSTNGTITYTFSTTAIVVTDVLATAGTVISWIQTGK